MINCILAFFKALASSSTTTTILRAQLTRLSDVDHFLDIFRKKPYGYCWGTIRNYIVLIGKLSDCLYSKHFFEAKSDWFNIFKINFANAMRTCKSQMMEDYALKAREVSY